MIMVKMVLGLNLSSYVQYLNVRFRQIGPLGNKKFSGLMRMILFFYV